MNKTDTLNYDEAAEHLGVSVRWLRAQAGRGLITFYWLGSRKVCDRADLEALPGIVKELAEQKVPPTRQSVSRRRRAERETLPPGDVEVDPDIKRWVTRRASA